ncbi:PhiH1 repressor [Halarchaeum nitratireducens]|uniref:PhiH1 repressor n=1 Tax=Halarchaeum nitratireducens TaxID=489913 RepID=A0A830GB08_9EURY|nr:PhiH1 repressor [Halarchaeum nitratireducens]
MSVRRSGPWMQAVDERILEHLAESRWASPTTMTAVLPSASSRRRIWDRCRLLSEAGLIGPLWPGTRMYEITTSGQLYLDGELNTHDVPAPGPVRVGPPPKKEERPCYTLG